MVELSQDTGTLDFLHQLNDSLDEVSLEQSRTLINQIFVLMRSAAILSQLCRCELSGSSSFTFASVL